MLNGRGSMWHAPAKFPLWVQFKYEKPFAATQFAMKSQGTSPGGSEYKRVPSEFIFQGSSEGKNWKDLLRVDNAKYEFGDQWKHWKFNNNVSYKYYRIFITGNSGDGGLTTIQKVKIEN